MCGWGECEITRPKEPLEFKWFPKMFGLYAYPGFDDPFKLLFWFTSFTEFYLERPSMMFWFYSNPFSNVYKLESILTVLKAALCLIDYSFFWLF